MECEIPVVTINRRETIQFFDEIPPYSKGQATSIVSVVGEDLAVGCLQRYLEGLGALVEVRSEPVTTGSRSGSRLDRWVVVVWPDGRRVAYQTEIKNWSAHAIGGAKLPLNASEKELISHKQERWDKQWDTDGLQLRDGAVGKVLTPMKKPSDLSGMPVLPLAIYWMPIGPGQSPDQHLFTVKTGKSCVFRELSGAIIKRCGNTQKAILPFLCYGCSLVFTLPFSGLLWAWSAGDTSSRKHPIVSIAPGLVG